MKSSNVKEILESLGYQLNNHNHYYTTRAEYRSGENPGSLGIYPRNNLVIDFVTGQKFSIKKLIALTLKLESEEDVKIWLNKKQFVLPKFEIVNPEIKMPKTYPTEWLNDLLEIHDYWNVRGISSETLKPFRCGLRSKTAGKMVGRYVFTVWNSQNQLVGLAGRDVTNKSKTRWQLMGTKSEWLFPLFLNADIIKKKKEIILLEGIPDVLSCFEAGIKNCICLFGTEMSLKVLNMLIKFDIKKIIITLNNDGPGMEASEKLQNRLLKYFDRRRIQIVLPPGPGKDMNDLLNNGGVDSIHHCIYGIK